MIFKKKFFILQDTNKFLFIEATSKEGDIKIGESCKNSSCKKVIDSFSALAVMYSAFANHIIITMLSIFHIPVL